MKTPARSRSFLSVGPTPLAWGPSRRPPRRELESQAPGSAYALATSDDPAALEIAAGQAGIRAGRSPHGELAIAVQDDCLDAFVLALGDARIAIRRLELLVSPLETMFHSLTGGGAPEQLEPYELAERVLARA